MKTVEIKFIDGETMELYLEDNIATMVVQSFAESTEYDIITHNFTNQSITFNKTQIKYAKTKL